MAPILSIVVPTRNRLECAFNCVAAAMEATRDAEVVIADSSDDDVLHRRLLDAGLEPSRIRYVRTPTDWNVVRNFEGALDHCRGDFVIYVGDDDFVGPGIEEICEWARAEEIDALVGYGDRFGAAYYWPGVKSRYFGTGYEARAFVWSCTSQMLPIDTQAEIEAARWNAGKGLGLLPRIYHGLVSRNLLQRVAERHGHVFGGVSPDIYSSILIATEAHRAVYLDYPFCVPGVSPRSEAGSGAAQTDRLRFEDSPYLRRFKNLEWDPEVPRFFAPLTVWAFSLNEALKRVGRPLDEGCLGYLYARCLMYCWPYRAEVVSCLRVQAGTNGWLAAARWLTQGVLVEMGSLAVRVGKKIFMPRAGGWARRYPGLDDSLAAYRFLREHLPRPRLSTLRGGPPPARHG
jgi:glycosyltransferase involved in cell wall biosynthesis